MFHVNDSVDAYFVFKNNFSISLNYIHYLCRMKILLLILGFVSLTLGVVGIFIPLLPTTPLLLLAAWCFFRSSTKIYNKLIESKHLGTYIRNFRENKIIPIRTKIFTISLLWLSLIYCIFFVVTEKLWLQVILAIILISVTIHILSYKSK